MRTACLLALTCLALSAAELRVVPTFENASVYAEGTDLAPDQVTVHYRESGSDTWIDAHPLVATEAHPTPRGSIFGLRSGTTYDVRLRDAAGAEIASATTTTWSDEVPIAKTIDLSHAHADGGPLTITEGGSADGWVRYVGAPGYVLDGGDESYQAILIEKVSHIIIEDLTVVGGRHHGIQVKSAKHIRLRNLDVSGWGRLGIQNLEKDGKFYLPGESKAVNFDGGVFINLGAQVVVERSWFHDPRATSNHWGHSHPAGPTAIFVRSAGGTVIRYNDFVGGDAHRWNDTIEGYGNGKPEGGFNADGDVYGNYFAFCNDDGIELDGDQENVRVYANHLLGALCGISTAPNQVGPSYLIGNLVTDLGDERGAASGGIKAGGDTRSPGMTFFYHNSFVTPGRGIAGVGFGGDKERKRFGGVTEGNITVTTGSGISAPYPRADNRYGRDLVATPWGSAGSVSIPEHITSDAITADAALRDIDAGDYSPGAGSPAIGAGRAIPGMAWYQGSEAIDLGATAAGRALPWRDTAVAVSPRRIELKTVRGASDQVSATVTLNGAKLTTDQAFTIRTNAAFTWLSVEPRSGVIPAGGSATLRIGLTPEADARSRNHGALLIDLGDGLRVPVTVFGSVIAADQRIVIEAESAPGAEGFETSADDSATGGAYLSFVPATQRKLGPEGLAIPFELEAEGGWYIAARIRCAEPLGNHDSLFIGIDEAKVTMSAIRGGGTAWRWISLGGAQQLSAGAHTLHLHPRETLDLDAIVITPAPLAMRELGGQLDTE